jgi:hypothetical protein
MAVKFTAKQWETMSKKLHEQFPDSRISDILDAVISSSKTKSSRGCGSKGGGRNPYILWMKDNRASIKEELGPDAKIGDISKRGGELWKLLSEEDKKPYLEQAAAAKENACSAGPKRSTSPKSPFERSDETATIDGYEGPVIGKFLMKRVAPGWGVGRFGTLAEAVEAANKLGGQCGGITMEKNAYILQIGNDFITPPPGHRALPENDCWMAWRKVDHVAEAVEKPKRVKKSEKTPVVEIASVESTETVENTEPKKMTPEQCKNDEMPPLEDNEDTNDDDDDDDDEEIDVEPWEYDGTTYLLDTNTNQVYDAETQTVIGQRVGGKLAKF